MLFPKKVDRNKYKFTGDWFSHDSESKVVKQFDKFLSPLKGKPCNILEIGCYEGMSATWYLDHILTHKDSKLVCIDLALAWTGNAFQKLIENIYRSEKQDQVKIIKGSSLDHLTDFPRNHFDFIYIDGNHEAEVVLEEAILCFRILKVGGIIAFDDYLIGIRWPKSPGALALKHLPKKSMDAFLDIYQDKLEVIYKDYQLWIRKIKD